MYVNSKNKNCLIVSRRRIEKNLRKTQLEIKYLEKYS